jgi:hypothetical protein
MSAINVEVVRPKKSAAEQVGALLGVVLNVFLSGWILMLILGAVSTWTPSYWHSVLVVIAVRVVLPGASYLFWTKRDKS